MTHEECAKSSLFHVNSIADPLIAHGIDLVVRSSGWNEKKQKNFKARAFLVLRAFPTYYAWVISPPRRLAPRHPVLCPDWLGTQLTHSKERPSSHTHTRSHHSPVRRYFFGIKNEQKTTFAQKPQRESKTKKKHELNHERYVHVRSRRDKLIIKFENKTQKIKWTFNFTQAKHRETRESSKGRKRIKKKMKRLKLREMARRLHEPEQGNHSLNSPHFGV